MQNPTGTPVSTPTSRPDGGVITRYLTVGGATVELHTKHFTTKTDYRGYYHPETSFEIDGHDWRCLGCDAVGYDSEPGQGFRRLSEARSTAQEHAEYCRAMPKDDQQADATPDPIPDPGDSCRCVWQGGTCVETCPGHSSDAWFSRLLARLNGKAGR